MGGQSSRFPDSKPKWMLTHPKSKTYMVLESIKGINLDFFDKIVFTFLKSHQEQYNFVDCFINELIEQGINEKSEILFLENSTNSQPETVYQTIKKLNIEDFIFIKDCDNYFETEISEKVNQVCYFDLHKLSEVNANSKSYIQLDNNNNIINIVEKHIISSTFVVGGYGFSNSSDFIEHYEKNSHLENGLFISNIIFSMLLEKHKFVSKETNNYIDWGTLKEWNKYTDGFQTLFIDLDGTLVTNSSHLAPPIIGDAKPLDGNIEKIRSLYETGKYHIIITTSRLEKYRSQTITELSAYGIPYDSLIMDLPHCKRTIINDFANSNRYPSCIAINIPRNNNCLSNFLD
jgi:hypothetical protein